MAGASLVRLALILVLPAHRVIINVRLHPLSLRRVLMVGWWDFLCCSHLLSIKIDVLATSLSHPCVDERPGSLRGLTAASLLVTYGHVSLIPAVVILTYVTHLTLVSNFGLLTSDFPYRTGVVFAEIDAIFLAMSLVGGGEVLVIHIISHCIQLTHIILHSRVILSLDSLRLLLD